MEGAAVPGGADESLRASAHALDSEKDVVPDPFGWAALCSVLVRFLCILPVLAGAAAFLFASFWFASSIVLVIGTIAAGWLGVLAAMLAFDCLPEGVLGAGPFGLVRRVPGKLTGAVAAKELGFSRNLDFYLVYAGVFWVVALAIATVAARLFLL